MATQFDDVLNVQRGNQSGGAGNDTFILSGSLIEAGEQITISDSEGLNTIQLINGLEIVSTSSTATATQLTLNNGAVVTVLGADTFTYEIGGNPLLGEAGVEEDYPTFVTNTLGLASVPGDTPVSGTAVTVGVEPSTIPTFSISAVDATEGGDAVFTVTLTGNDATEAYGVSFAVSYAGGATDADHGAVDMTSPLSFAPGETTKTITIPVTADGTSPEDGEGITVTLSSPTGVNDGEAAVLSDTGTAATSSITDVPVTFAFAESTEAEVTEGQTISFTVEASAPVDEDTTVSFVVVPGDSSASNQGTTLTNLNDFDQGSFNPANLVIPKGETSVTFELTTKNEQLTELVETFQIKATVNGEELLHDVSMLDGGVTDLTSGVDDITGTSSNDTFSAVVTADAATTTLNALDSIDGGNGTDTLSILHTGGTVLPAGVSLTSVENLAIRSSTAVTADASAAGYSSLSNLSVTQAAGAVDLNASSKTGVTVSMTAAGAKVDVDGGKDVSVTLTEVTGASDVITVGGGATAPVGTITVSETGAASTAGTDVTLSAISSKGGTTVDITQVATSDSSAAAADTAGATITQGDITVTGGTATTSVTVEQDATVAEVLAVAAVEAKSATQDVSFAALKTGETTIVDFGGGNTLTFTAKKDLDADEVATAFANLVSEGKQGKASAELGLYTNAGLGVSTGWTSGDITKVSETESKVTFTNSMVAMPTAIVDGTGDVAVTPGTKQDGTAAIPAVTGVLGVIAGKVTVTDTNQTMTTVDIDAYGASSKIDNSAKLATLSLANAGNAVDMTVADTADTLALTVEKLGDSKAGDAKLTLTDAPTTLNVTSTGSNYIDLKADKTETLSVSGTGLLDIDVTDLAALKTLSVTGSAGVALHEDVADTLTSVDASGTSGNVTVSLKGDTSSYKGGAGVDTVTVTNPGTAVGKSIDLGAGDDTLDLSAGDTTDAATPTVNLIGGNGTDTLKLTAAAAVTASAATTFETKIEGFERLSIGAVGADSTVNADNLDDINYFITNGDGGADFDLTLDKLLSGATVDLAGDHSFGADAGVIVQLADATGSSDVLNLIATNATIGIVNADDIETVNVTTATTNVTALTLDADAATKIDVAGSVDLALTLSADTKEVSAIDASDRTGGTFSVSTLAGDTGATTVTGGAGTDNITLLGANDVAIGGAGNDTLAVSGTAASATTLTGGDGTDVFNVSAFKAANAGAAVTITDFTEGEMIQFVSHADADFKSAAVSLIEESTFTEYVTEAGNQAGGQYGIAWFQFNNNTFIVQDVDANAGFTDAQDIIVKLNGLVDLSDSSFNEVTQGTLMFV